MIIRALGLEQYVQLLGNFLKVWSGYIGEELSYRLGWRERCVTVYFNERVVLILKCDCFYVCVLCKVFFNLVEKFFRVGFLSERGIR